MRLSWESADVALASAFTAALLIDAGQTRGLARGGWNGWRESNPILGPRPSVARINAYTAVAGVSVLATAAVLPPRLRRWLLGAALAVQVVTLGTSIGNSVPLRIP